MFILLLFNLIKTCPLESMYTSINNLNALIPINHLIMQLKNPITLQSNTQFSNLTLNQKIIDYTQLNVGEIQFTFNSILAFQFINNTYQSIGYAVIENVTLNMQFQFNNQQYDLQSSTFQIPNTFTNVQTMFYYTYYQMIVNLLNAQLITQIQNAYNGLQFTLPIYSDLYLYQYTNINGNIENINFIYQQSNESYQNQTLISYGQLNINQYDQNICNNVTLPNNISSLPQVQIFSNSIIQTIIQYGYQQNYFNTILNQNWQSQDFQFYVESLQYLLYNLDQFDLYSPITGYCNLTSQPIYNVSSILLNYGCNLFVEDQSIIQISLNLTLNLKFQQIDTQIQILCQDYTFTSYKIYNEKFEPKVFSLQLDNYIIQSILNTHLKNSELFGSGFKTIPRRNGTIYLTSDYLMIFDY